MADSPIHEVERLIKQLDNPIRSAKSKAAIQLASYNIFPSIILDPDQFLHEVVTPVLSHVSDNAESVRENCIKAIEKYVTDLYNEIIKGTPSNLSEIFLTVLPPLLSRLEDEKIENAEHLRFYLLKILLKFVKMITSLTIPNNLDQFVDDMINPLLVSFKSKEADMKKLGCDFLDAILLRCSKEKLIIISENISQHIFSNCFHHHYEVRKKSIHSLALLYVSSGTFSTDNAESIINSLHKLSEDRNSNVRKEVIFFCTIILTQHEEKNKYYFPLLIPLLYFLSPIIPQKETKIEGSASMQQKKMTDESKISLNSLNEIGSIYSSENDDINDRILDESNNFIANNGIVHLICDYSNSLLNVLLPMINEWTENLRNYGFSCLISFIQLAGSYLSRYSPHIIQSLVKSLHDNKEDFEKALQCQSILSSFLSLKEIVDFLLPQISSDKSREVIQLLTVSIINNECNEVENNEQLELILNQCLTIKIYQELDLIELLVQLVLAMIKKSSFVNQNSLQLSIFILKLCEKTDALKCFLSAFEKPISFVFAENFEDLIKYEEKNAVFMKIILDVSPIETIFENRDLVASELSSLFDSNPSERAIIKEIVDKIKKNKCLSQFSIDT